MFLWASGHHFGAHPDGHQHGVSIQISINLGKTFLHISCLRKSAMTWIMARGFAYLPSFFSQILDFMYSVERFWFLLRSTLNAVTLKTSNILYNYPTTLYIRNEPFHLASLSDYDASALPTKALHYAPMSSSIFSVFISHVVKTKNRNHSINKVKNMGYNRWLLYKQPC